MIGVVGINHKTAPVAVREKLYLDSNAALALLGRLCGPEHRGEGVVLSTCHRSEVYFHLPDSCPGRGQRIVVDLLADSGGMRVDAERYFYSLAGEQAVGHLFEVAAGLDSMVLGENQILGQIKEAYRLSTVHRCTGPVLNRLFHRAFEVGKRVRAETAINEGASSIGYAAVELSARIFDHLPAHPVLLIGAGEMGELVLQSLVQRGNRHVHVANRTPDRARELAGKYGAEAAGLEALDGYFTHCDIIITSTASPQPIVRLEHLRRAMARRPHRALFVIDLSVPRAVEEGTERLEGVFLYNIDDLEAVVARNREKRRGEIEKAGALVAEYTAEFFSWLDTLNLKPTIDGLRDKLASIAFGELDELKCKMTAEEFEKVYRFADFLQGKYLGLVIRNLKKMTRGGSNQECIDVIHRLFELRGKESR